MILDGGRVTLDLWLGDINDLTDTLDDSMNQTVDAWFLDGFAPAKNPDMWSQHLFSAMARLARPGATLATFTSAGFVRRGLQEAGFTMHKTKGFGRKRDMLVGRMEQTLDIPASAPWFARRASASREVAIVGGGSPALCCLSRFSTAAGRSRSTVLTTRQQAVRPATARGALSAFKRARPGPVPVFPGGIYLRSSPVRCPAGGV